MLHSTKTKGSQLDTLSDSWTGQPNAILYTELQLKTANNKTKTSCQSSCVHAFTCIHTYIHTYIHAYNIKAISREQIKIKIKERTKITGNSNCINMLPEKKQKQKTTTRIKMFKVLKSKCVIFILLFVVVVVNIVYSI